MEASRSFERYGALRWHTGIVGEKAKGWEAAGVVSRSQCELRRQPLVLLVQWVLVTREVISSNQEAFPLFFKTGLQNL